MNFEPHEATAKLRQIAADLKELADWKGDPQIDKDYGRRGFDLLTAAWVMGFWASRIEAAINQEDEPCSSPAPT